MGHVDSHCAAMLRFGHSRPQSPPFLLVMWSAKPLEMSLKKRVALGTRMRFGKVPSTRRLLKIESSYQGLVVACSRRSVSWGAVQKKITKKEKRKEKKKKHGE